MIRQGPFQQAESADGHSEAHGFRHSAGCDIGDENTGNNEEFIGDVSYETVTVNGRGLDDYQFEAWCDLRP